MKFFRRPAGAPQRIGILPGTFNPITLAHVAMAHAALPAVDEVVFVLPRALPHKEYTGATFAERVEMLRVALANDPQCAIAATDQGLFLEIAEECRAAYPAGVRLSFLCGRDAAERIAGWDYGRPGAFGEMLRKFDLLVAARRGEYQPAPEVRQAVERLPLPAEFEEVSSSAVRGRIARGEPWQHLVPPPIREMAERIYGRPESVLGR